MRSSPSALYDLIKVFNATKYTIKGGARKLFADLLVCANRMPAPPGIYEFKVAIMKRLPEELRKVVAMDGITAEGSTLDEIMRKTISVEQGLEASAFYGSMTKGKGPVPKTLAVVQNARYQVEDHSKVREQGQAKQQQ
ncbi:hypothetical protein PQX77_017706 [Marasmius sp. AFHP31]|nr:hypothetical protein PQX77_017706 [Marasmius sp. AFHP31]